jgi:hypothetical protein
LHVDAAAMATNLEQLADAVDITDVGHTGELVDRYLDGRDRG